MRFHRSVMNENAFGAGKTKLGHAYTLLRIELKQLEQLISADRKKTLNGHF